MSLSLTHRGELTWGVQEAVGDLLVHLVPGAGLTVRWGYANVRPHTAVHGLWEMRDIDLKKRDTPYDDRHNANESHNQVVNMKVLFKHVAGQSVVNDLHPLPEGYGFRACERTNKQEA